MINCRICGGFISYDWSNLSAICASCHHKSDWVEAEYATMAWPKVEEESLYPLQDGKG